MCSLLLILSPKVACGQKRVMMSTVVQEISLSQVHGDVVAVKLAVEKTDVGQCMAYNRHLDMHSRKERATYIGLSEK